MTTGATRPPQHQQSRKADGRQPADQNFICLDVGVVARCTLGFRSGFGGGVEAIVSGASGAASTDGEASGNTWVVSSDSPTT